MMEDKENLNNDDLLNSSMFASGDGDGGQMDSMFAAGNDAAQEDSMFAEAPNEAESAPNPEPAEKAPVSDEKVKPEPNETKPQESAPSPKEAEKAEEEKEEDKPKIAEKEPIQVIEDFDEEDEEAPTDVVTVRPVKFKKFEATPPVRAIKKNLDIMQDISMHISVELGRTKLSIKEVMDFEAGSIVELNKIAGEQVEVFVNGKLVAKGEVIVIEDRFGVRITSTNIGKNAVIP